MLINILRVLKTRIFYNLLSFKSLVRLVYLPFVMKIKASFLLVLIGVVLVSCKDKKKKDSDPEPEPVKYGTVTYNVITYDSLGQPQTDHSGVTVKLNNSGSTTTITSSTGVVKFENVQYGTLVPVLIKTDYEGVPLSVELNSPALNVNLPIAQRSTFQISNFSGQHVNQDSIAVSFDLSQAPPAGKMCRIAIITATAGLSPNNYTTLDTFNMASQHLVKYNICKLPNLRTYVNSLDSGKLFYVGAVSLSYGAYKSNLFAKPVLVGEHLLTPDNLVFTKNWK